MHTRGVLLVQPEYLLSFELMTSWSWETSWVLTQDSNWLESNPRDILDESDEILSAWFELIHTIIDLQRAIEFSPDRSTIIDDL